MKFEKENSLMECDGIRRNFLHEHLYIIDY